MPGNASGFKVARLQLFKNVENKVKGKNSLKKKFKNNRQSEACNRLYTSACETNCRHVWIAL